MKLIFGLGVSLFLAGLVYWRFPGLIIRGFNRALRIIGRLERKEIYVGDCKWVYLDGGKGDVIVFLHGFGADKDRFWTLLPGFSRSYRVIAPDLPGFGESCRDPAADHSVAVQAKRLNGFVEGLGLESFHLAGISLGGAIAAYYASEYSEKVKSLFLMAPLGVGGARMSYALRRFVEEGINILRYKTVEEVERLMAALFYRPPRIPRRLKQYLIENATADFEIREKIMGDILASGLDFLESRLNRIKADTLVVWGKEDNILDVSAAEKITARIPHCRLFVFEGCGHVPYYERGRDTIRTYRTFLRSVCNG